MNKDELYLILKDRFDSPNLPQNISEELFNDIIDICINNNDFESLWRLYFKYSNYNPSKIEDFYIMKRNSYYVCELISIRDNSMDIDNFIKKIIETNDINFISWIYLNKMIYGIIPDYCINLLKNSIGGK